MNTKPILYRQSNTMSSFKRKSLKVLKRGNSKDFSVKTSFDRAVSEDSTDAASSGSYQMPPEEPMQSYKVFGDPVDVLKYDIGKYRIGDPACPEAKTCYLPLLEDTEGWWYFFVQYSVFYPLVI